MDELVAVVPDLWADHHVLSARAALLELPGVERVEASARDLTVRVAYDPQATGEAAIVAALTAAGYPPGEPDADEAHKDKPAWATAPRVTGTNATDLAMSGDYRKY
jgi:copper chaperone CopZ